MRGALRTHRTPPAQGLGALLAAPGRDAVLSNCPEELGRVPDPAGAEQAPVHDAEGGPDPPRPTTYAWDMPADPEPDGHVRDAVPDTARAAILAWYDATGRQLAFRSTADPYAVMRRMGHSSITLTLQTYSHVIPSLQEEAAKRLDVIMGS